MGYHQRRLPHWHLDGRPVFLAWCLRSSLPRNRYPPPGSLSAGKVFVWMDRFLDTARTGPHYLRLDSVAALVVGSIRFGEQSLHHYEIGAAVAMPNHVHLSVRPFIAVPN